LSGTEAASKAIAEKREGYKLDKKSLSRYTGYSVSWIEKLIKEGAPVYKVGRPGIPLKIDSAQFLNWLLEREKRKTLEKYGLAGDGSDAEAKKRLNMARAEIAELELARIRGQFVEIDTVCSVLDKIIAACRARLLAIPTKTAPVVVAAETIGEANDIIENEIHEALNELSRLDPADFITDDKYETLEPAAEVDGE